MREPILLTLAILTQYRHFVTHTVPGLTDSVSVVKRIRENAEHEFRNIFKSAQNLAESSGAIIIQTKGRPAVEI
jgi:hypothetical protein